MTTKIIDVAAGVVLDAQGRILIAKRPQDKHQGGLWEFPGGKIEAGETAHQALVRELEEEVGIRIGSTESLIQVQHSYPDKTVRLHVLRTSRFTGEAWGREAQEIKWVAPEQLPSYAFPAANTPIIAAARLPRQLMITGQFSNDQAFLERLAGGLDRQVGMVQFRAPWLNEDQYIALARRAHVLCRAKHVPLIANCAVDTFRSLDCEGLHLTSSRLAALCERPVDESKWLSAACHNAEEIARAQGIGADFALLSPVLTTTSHPGARAMGWSSFASIVQSARIPVYALGGLKTQDLATAIQHGAQGIAAVSAYW